MRFTSLFLILAVKTLADSVAIERITVVDMTSGSLQQKMTVVVVGSRIIAVAPSGKVRIPKDAQVVDGRGKYIIPGLWDMHAHWLTDAGGEWNYPLYLVGCP